MAFFKHLLNHLLRSNGKEEAPPPRIFAYCASNIGMGHYVRLVRVLREYIRRRPQTSVLMATDARELSIAADACIATLRLPGYCFNGDGKFSQSPEHLSITNDELHNLRERLLMAAADEFRPDLVIMDSLPHGKRNEMAGVLRSAREAGARSILIMRDIPSLPGDTFKLSGPADKIEREAELYDSILIAGDKGLFDAARTFQWPPAVREKLQYIGFVLPPAETASRAEAFAMFGHGLDSAKPTIVASLGGGWSGEEAIERLLDGALKARERLKRPVQMILFTGPAVKEEQLESVRRRATAAGGVIIERFTNRFAPILAHSDLAILQAGSTVYQVLEGSKPLILLCRKYKSREQDERARRLAHLPGVRVVESDDFETTDLGELIGWGLAQKHAPRKTGFSYDGPARAAAAIDRLLK
ncbi:MAG: glycosyltransferase [Candidatus Sumerlaeia bacterium]